MKIEEIEKKAGQIRTLKWLQGIADNYEWLIGWIDREKEYFRLTQISFACRSEGEKFDINPHHPIPYTFIRDGLAAAVKHIKEEIIKLTKEIEDES